MRLITQNISPRRLTAKELKEMIRPFLFLRDNNGIIGSEVMYGSSRRVADMVFISKGHSYAIEIKSAYDSTIRLEEQLKDYQTLFDYILVFTAPNHLNRIKAKTPDFIGLYSVNEDGIKTIRREKKNHFVQKSEMLISIPSAVVKTVFSIKGKLSSDEIRAQALRKSKREIHNSFINYFKHRLIPYSPDSLTIIENTPEQSELAQDYIIV